MHPRWILEQSYTMESIPITGNMMDICMFNIMVHIYALPQSRILVTLAEFTVKE